MKHFATNVNGWEKIEQLTASYQLFFDPVNAVKIDLVHHFLIQYSSYNLSISKITKQNKLILTTFPFVR